MTHPLKIADTALKEIVGGFKADAEIRGYRASVTPWSDESWTVVLRHKGIPKLRFKFRNWLHLVGFIDGWVEGYNAALEEMF